MILPFPYSIVEFIFNVVYPAMWLRFGLDIYRQFNPSWRPTKLVLWVAEIVMTITDWFLKPIRKVIRPIRIGPVAIDLSWTIAMVLIYVLQSLLYSLVYAIVNSVR